MSDPATAEGREKQHEQNLRDLALIRDDPGWALTAVQQWRRLSEQVDALSARLAQAEQERDEANERVELLGIRLAEQHVAASEEYNELTARLREYEEALTTIAECSGSDMHGDVDEWSEAAAFAKVQEIARAALAKDTHG